MEQGNYKSTKDMLHIAADKIFYYKLRHFLKLLQIMSKNYHKSRQVVQIAALLQIMSY